MAKGRTFKRCMWYNELGEPRINPSKVKKGLSDTTGCQHDRNCNFVHPGDPGWLDAPFTAPKPYLYEDGIVPPTPSPPWTKRPRTPDFDRVKQEYMSPTISSKFEHEPASARSHDRRGSRSPRDQSGTGSRSSREWDRGKRYDYGESSSTGRSRDAGRERTPRDREYESRREGDYRRDRGQDTDRDYRLSTSIDRTHERRRMPSEPDAHRGNLDSPSEPTRTASSSFLGRERDRPAPASGDPRRTSPKAASRFNADRAYPQTPPLPQPAVASSSRLSASSSAGSPRAPLDSALSTMGFASHASSMLPPPTPMSATPAPIPPSFLTSPQIDIPKKRVLSLEETKEIWDKRIELFAEAISARQAYKGLSDDIKVLQSLVKSSRYANSSSALRDPIDATIANTERQRDEARKRAEEVLNRVYALDFWPLRKRPTGDQADDSVGPDDAALWEDEQQEIKSMVNDLSGAVSRLDRQLKEVFKYVLSRTRANVQATSSNLSEQEMQLDGARGAKRRKVGDEGAYASDSGSTIVGHMSPVPSFVSPAGENVLDPSLTARFIRRLEALEATYADLENFCTQSEHTRTDEVGGIVDAHLERFRSQLGRTARVNQMELLKTLEAGLEQTGNDVGELASTVAELVESVGNFRSKEDAYAAEHERERAKIYATIEANRADTEAVTAQTRANLEETAALRDALARMQQPTPAPHVPSVDEIAEALLPRVLDSVREEFAALLAGARSELVAVVRAEMPAIELIRDIREKAERVQRLPEVVALLDNLPRETNGLAAAVPVTATDENKPKKNQQANGHGHAT